MLLSQKATWKRGTCRPKVTHSEKKWPKFSSKICWIINFLFYFIVIPVFMNILAENFIRPKQGAHGITKPIY